MGDFYGKNMMVHIDFEVDGIFVGSELEFVDSREEAFAIADQIKSDLKKLYGWDVVSDITFFTKPAAAEKQKG